MKNRLTALLLCLLLCLSAVTPALAAAETHSVDINESGLPAGYYMGAVWNGSTLVALFDATVGNDGVLKQTVDLGDTPLGGSTVRVSISQPNVTNGHKKTFSAPIKTNGSSSNNPGDNNNPGGTTPDNPGTSTPTYYSIYRDVSSNGSVIPSTYSAASGDSVTLYVYPHSGYELSSLRVVGSNGRTVSTYSAGTNRYTFIMPPRNVTVYASFSWITDYTGSSSSGTTVTTPATIPVHKSFADNPATRWALQGSGWAYASGVMEGMGSLPDSAVTQRQLWTAMSRIAGNWPADMSEARTWAVNSGLTDGSNPTAAVTRQQLAKAMYTYVELSGYELLGGADLTAYPDYGSVSAADRTALAWAVDYQIILPTEDGQLAPASNVTYSELAVVLDRLYNGYLYIRSQNPLC